MNFMSKNRDATFCVKKRVMDAAFRSSILYSSESWFDSQRGGNTVEERIHSRKHKVIHVGENQRDVDSVLAKREKKRMTRGHPLHTRAPLMAGKGKHMGVHVWKYLG